MGISLVYGRFTQLRSIHFLEDFDNHCGFAIPAFTVFSFQYDTSWFGCYNPHGILSARANYKEDMMKPYRRKVIGAIDGITVQGQYYDDDGKPSVVLMQWKSWEIETDGISILFPATGDEIGHMLVSDWARMKELAQTDVIERLIEMGREWVKTPPLKG